MKKIVMLILAALILSACGGESIDIEGDKVTYEELQDKIKDAEKEFSDISQELIDKKDHYKELKKLDSKQDKLIDSVVDYEKEITSVEKELEEKQKELDEIEGKITKVKDEPIKINPGVYYFGEDIKEGRYKLTNQDGYNGNVFFRGDDNFGETFGQGEYSIEEYTFYADEGDEIEATIPILLYPVE